MRPALLALPLLFAALMAGPSAAQTPFGASPAPTLTIAGDITTPLTLSPADLKALPRTTLTVRQDDGTTVTYEGVLVGELLKRAGAPLGRDLSGQALATYVLASASDGYRVVYSLGELDPAMTGEEVIVADTIDGKALFDYQGPFRIVAPHDKRGARSVRMLERLDVVRLKKSAGTD
jgi:hypothetical protein